MGIDNGFKCAAGALVGVEEGQLDKVGANDSLQAKS